MEALTFHWHSGLRMLRFYVFIFMPSALSIVPVTEELLQRKPGYFKKSFYHQIDGLEVMFTFLLMLLYFSCIDRLRSLP